MEFENYLNFTPIFYSEGNSTYILSEVLSEQSVAKHFIYKITGIMPEESCSVKREQKVGSSGNIDLLIETRLEGKDSIMLVACTVNDYKFSQNNLLVSFYSNAKELYREKNIYLLYITQFTDSSIYVDSESLVPPTIKEYENTLTILNDYKSSLFHFSWTDVHAIIGKHNFSPELFHILNLHKNWIREKNRQDFWKRSADIASHPH